MKKILVSVASAAVLAATSGCIVVPPRAEYGPPPGVAYVGPTYVSPGVGWVWAYHPQYGWGWRHPQYGWHRGWR